MFKTRKDENFVYVKTNLPKRNYKEDKKLTVFWDSAFEEASKAFPDLQLEKRPDNLKIATNYSSIKNVEWKFFIITEEEKQRETKKETNTSSKKKERLQEKEPQRLTDLQEFATLKKTSQRLSDQPAIVQEPTE